MDRSNLPTGDDQSASAGRPCSNFCWPNGAFVPHRCMRTICTYLPALPSDERDDSQAAVFFFFALPLPVSTTSFCTVCKRCGYVVLLPRSPTPSFQPETCCGGGGGSCFIGFMCMCILPVGWSVSDLVVPVCALQIPRASPSLRVSFWTTRRPAACLSDGAGSSRRGGILLLLSRRESSRCLKKNILNVLVGTRCGAGFSLFRPRHFSCARCARTSMLLIYFVSRVSRG